MKRKNSADEEEKSTKKRAVSINLPEHGIEIITKILKISDVESILNNVNKAVKKCKPEDLGDVRGDRIDVPLSLHKFYEPLKILLNPQKELVQILKNHLGENASLVEFAAMVANPGSVSQPPHVDSSKIEKPVNSEPPHILTTFVALQDISADMGPLEVWPKTHLQWVPESEDVNTTENSILMTVNSGSCYVMDSRVVHRGLKNNSSIPRVLLYFSFQRKKSQNLYSGSTYTIRSDYINKFTLEKLHEMLQVNETVEN